MNDNPTLLEAARALALGQPIDWNAVAATATGDRLTVELLRELQVVQGIEELHRSAALPGGPSASGSADDDPATGESSWGPLRLLERIGRGAFGDVYRAWDPRLDRQVALKLLRRQDAGDDAVASMVIEEGRLLARVHHANVVSVFGADRIDGRVGLWMEFVEGRTLEAVLHDDGPLDPMTAAAIGIDLCRALAAVHRAGMIHLDVKAQNVMREASGRTVLMDFGAGREALAQRPVELAGTPLYLAPEVLARSAATPRSDLYSVGVLLFHLLTGSYPIKGASLDDIRAAHAGRRRTALRNLRPQLPEALCAAIDRALETQPSRRPANAEEMERELENALLTLRPPSVELPNRRRPAFTASLVAFAATVAIFAVVPLRISSWNGSTARPRESAGRVQQAPLPPTHVPRPDNVPPAGQPSRDGRFFTFINEEGNVAVVELATGRVTALTRDAVINATTAQFALVSAISSDDQFVAYTWRAVDGVYELRVVPANGKLARVLFRSAAVEVPIPIEWSRDGTQVLALFAKSDGSGQLALVAAEAGTVQIVKELGPNKPSHASLSRDGAFVVFDAPQLSSASRDIVIIRTDGTDEHRLLAGPANRANPIWSADGQQVLFTTTHGGVTDLCAVQVQNGVAVDPGRTLRAGIGRVLVAGVTDSGDYLYHRMVGSVDVYQAEFNGRELAQPVQLGPDTSGSNLSSIWSPDARRLAYVARTGLIDTEPLSTTIVVRDLLTGAERRLRPLMTSFLLKSWSPDGRYLLAQGVDLRRRTGSHIIDTTNGRVTPLVTDEPVGRSDWLADGRVLYLSREKRQLIAIDPSTGSRQIAYDLRDEPGMLQADLWGRGFRLSPDGQTLALTVMTKEDGDWTTSLRLRRDGVSRELLKVRGMLRLQDWTPDSRSLIYTRWDPKPLEPVSLWRIDADGGVPQSLAFQVAGLRDVSINAGGTAFTFTAGSPEMDLFALPNILDRQ